MKPAYKVIAISMAALMLASPMARAQNAELEKSLDDKPLQALMAESCAAKRKSMGQDEQPDYCDCMGVGITVDEIITTEVKENLSYDFNFDTAVNPMMEEMKLTDDQQKQMDALGTIEKRCHPYITVKKDY